ncbi:MAG: FecR domain-containing protein [Saprospiraceae bacterium]|nr:FecR domain-containing protein [Saprospiraceae bacterium]
MNVRENIHNLNNPDASKEAEILASWKQEAEDTLSGIQAIAGINFPYETLKDYRQYPKETAFQKIISGNKQPGAGRVLPLIRKYAAAIAFLVVAVAAFYFTQGSASSDSMEKMVSAANFMQMVLPDGSQVTLDKYTAMSYGQSRNIKLDGRAFFNVSKTTDQQQFTVALHKGKITVLGTRFSVTSRGDLTEVAVEEGKVRYEYDGREIILSAGEWMKLSGEDIVSSQQISTNQFSWKDQVLEFKNTPIEKAIMDINRHFGTYIELAPNVQIKSECLITSKFSKEGIEAVLAEFKLLFNIQYHKKDTGYVITSIKC